MPKASSLAVKRGERVEVVRWNRVGEGWIPETVTGLYSERNVTELVLVVDGEPRNFPRAEWELCSA